MLGAAVGIPASSLCIMRRLHSITKIQAVSMTLAEVRRTPRVSFNMLTVQQKQRAVIIDSCICILFPIIYMVFGLCLPALKDTPLILPQHLSYKVTVSTSTSKLGVSLLFIIPSRHFSCSTCGPSLSGFVRGASAVRFSSTYLNVVSNITLVLTLTSFVRRQAQFSQFLSSNSSLTTSRYFRLMALACTEMLCTIPLAVLEIVLNATAAPVMPWTSWEDTHYHFSRVGQIPAVLWRSNHLVVVGYTLTRWSCVICAFLFFIFFGFATEARKYYSKTFTKVLLACCLKKPASTTSEKPGYVNKCSSFTGFRSNYRPIGSKSSSFPCTRPRAVLLLVP